MLKIIIINSLFIISIKASADGICTYMTGKPATNSIERFATSCDLQKRFAKDPEIESLHKKNIYEKLAIKLARKMEQNSEEMAVLANYYNVNNADLTMNSRGVAKECTLQNITSIENCHGKKKGPNFDEKINYLKKHLQKSKTNFSKDESLYGILAGKFTADLKGEEKACPVNSKSGLFLLKSQIYSKSAKEIVETIKNNDRFKEPELFQNFAQLKLLRDSPDPELMKKFKEHIKNIPANTDEVKYIASFFTNKDNNKIVAPALESQCKSMNENLTLYLCSDLNELASVEDKISRDLFGQLNIDDSLEDQYDVDLKDPSVLTAYGLQCLAKEKIKNNKFNNNKDADNTDNWYKRFTGNMRRFETSKAESADSVGSFCKMYDCSLEKVKTAESCKKGGPISSKDLSTLFSCNSNAVDCDDFILKSISLLNSIEKMKVSSDINNSDENLSLNSISKNASSRLPSFAENYLGIEGSLRALGKPITPEIVAEKTKEHEEKIRTMEDTRLAAKDEIVPPTPNVRPKEQTASDTRADEGSYSVEQAQNEFRTNRTTNNNFNSAIRTAPTKIDETKRSPIIAKNENSENLKEAQRMREEMEKLIAGMKGTGQDSSDLERQLEEMKAVTGGKKIAQQGFGSGQNKAEEERLRRWDQTLKDRSRDLDQYRRELDDRRFSERGSAREESGRAPAAKSVAAQDAEKADRDSAASSTGGGSANAIKLAGSSTPGKIDQKAETAAIIQSGKESSTMTTDELIKLSPENLEKFGIDASKPFTLRVNFNNATYDIPVKNFPYKGNSVLGPVVDKKNKQLNEFLLKSPLFKKYYDFKIDQVVNN